MTFKHGLLRIAIATALLGSALPGCDDSNDNPTPSSDGGKSGKGGKGGSAAKAGTGGKGGEAASGTGSSEAGKGGMSGSGGNAGSAGKAGSEAGQGGSGADCKGQADCVCGTPSKNEDFLNHCTDATCTPFDNSKLSKFKDGKLPAIP